MTAIIDSYVSQHGTLSKYLAEQGEISLKVDADRRFTKVLILACASYFEDEIIKRIESYVRYVTCDNETVVSLLKKKALSRQYHTLFDWDRKNANRFFSFFGDESKDRHSKDLKEVGDLTTQEANFMFLGSLRNTLVHTNFAIASIDETYEEIYQKYLSAHKFVDYIESHLNELSS
ncbi:MAG: HEPN domain-containing protein [Colwellia sp.]